MVEGKLKVNFVCVPISFCENVRLPYVLGISPWKVDRKHTFFLSVYTIMELFTSKTLVILSSKYGRGIFLNSISSWDLQVGILFRWIESTHGIRCLIITELKLEIYKICQNRSCNFGVLVFFLTYKSYRSKWPQYHVL